MFEEDFSIKKNADKIIYILI